MSTTLPTFIRSVSQGRVSSEGRPPGRGQTQAPLVAISLRACRMIQRARLHRPRARDRPCRRGVDPAPKARVHRRLAKGSPRATWALEMAQPNVMARGRCRLLHRYGVSEEKASLFQSWPSARVQRSALLAEKGRLPPWSFRPVDSAPGNLRSCRSGGAWRSRTRATCPRRSTLRAAAAPFSTGSTTFAGRKSMRTSRHSRRFSARGRRAPRRRPRARRRRSVRLRSDRS
mmetsp:Transcript_106710/g.299855  ORF Transcript_106710/g.299855 Transcript_106710/m.299855 type:complete len:230 (-) Transcript_106710:3383-4072(-)